MLLPLEVEDKYIGLGLAISSSLAIGTSFIITKKGLMDASDKHGFEGNGYQYLKNPIWWAGMITMVIGEVANFAAYTFAPPILVTPLGALSVLIGAVLAAIFLKEELGVLGKMGCAICLIGSVIIVLHAPPDKEIQTVDEILMYALQPGFMVYCIAVAAFAGVMIYKVAPKYGRKSPLIYISICATVGSVSVMSIKGFGIAVKLTMSGNNQFTHPSTYVFAIVVVVCILTQMNYFNKALDQFDTSLVNPIYYVSFTTCTLIASAILFHGFNTTSAVNTLSLLCGFLIIFSGVYLLNISRKDPNGRSFQADRTMDSIPMENGIASIQTRRSIQLPRNSFGVHRRSNSLRQEARLIGEYDEEQGLGLTRLDEENSPEEDDDDDDTYHNTIKNSGSMKSRASSEASPIDTVWERPYDPYNRHDSPRGSKHAIV
ncbi:magnesium transporter NIPA-domain-containing protein [Lipomyces tetrasporus]|uniref:Magnesium transporter NIPA-domain-containing protein n=1 Tax=Lipomyces tetrasporus TaxID=54092 RepID=A0AAD7QSQ7_9ASCO|nr:magnesium transporter NIPA-domain-containing protein [Lipomyces tetrasporus]KAJ8100621.1 magnesium transporter NIPA-domain-containing protein [Lipomyces tetrasporus]